MEKRPNDEGFIDSHLLFVDISFFEPTVNIACNYYTIIRNFYKFKSFK